MHLFDEKIQNLWNQVPFQKLVYTRHFDQSVFLPPFFFMKKKRRFWWKPNFLELISGMVFIFCWISSLIPLKKLSFFISQKRFLYIRSFKGLMYFVLEAFGAH